MNKRRIGRANNPPSIILLLLSSGYIKEAIKNCPLRPVLNRDLAGMRTMLDAYMKYNDRRYPSVHYELPGNKDLYLPKAGFERLQDAILKESDIFFQDAVLKERTGREKE